MPALIRDTGIIIEQLLTFQTPLQLDQLLLTREAYWMTQLFPLHPHGLNKQAGISLQKS